jgi:ribosomal protein S18 acetylase RimI-like enzyme
MLERTMDKRPELWEQFVPATREDEELIEEIDNERNPKPVPPEIDYRRATESDLDTILALAAQAKAFLASQGLDQWQNGYPNEENFRADMARGDGWLFTADGVPAGYLCITRKHEDAYDVIDGQWLTEGPYAAIHRITVSPDFRNRGIAGQTMAFGMEAAKSAGFSSLRIDTHEGNLAMRGMLEKNGFAYCGKILLANGEPRVAYEILL